MKQKRARTRALILVFVMAIVMAGCIRSGTKSKDSPLNSTSESSDSTGREGIGGMTAEGSGAAENAGREAEDTASIKGRYIETQIDMPKGFSGKGNICRLADKSLMLLDAANGTKSISTDNGKTWDTQTVSELESVMSHDGAEFTSMALTEDGEVFLSYISWEETDAGKSCPEKYLTFSLDDPGGTMHGFQLGIEDYKTNLTESVFTADGRVFAVTATSHVYEIDLEKESSRQIFALENGKGADLCTNGDLLIVTDGGKVYFYDPDSGEVTDEDEVLNDYIAKQSEKGFGIVMCAAKKGKDSSRLYLAGCNGIAGHVTGGSVMELLVDGTMSSLGDPSKIPEEIIQDEEGSFFVLFEDGEMDSYVYDEEAPAVPEKQISIHGLYDNETVRQAVSLFRKKNPDVFVRFEAAMSGENGMTESDAIKNLNTELLAGEGPDMILLDGMPLDSYEEKGILEDLSGLAAELERSEDYFEGILYGYEKEGGTYALPFRYQVPLLAGDSSALAEIPDLKNLADKAEELAALQTTEETVLGSYTPEEVLEKLYLTSANAWTSDSKEADKDVLKEFLTQAQRIYRADQKNLDAKELEAHREHTEHIRRAYKNDERDIAKVLSSISRVFNRIQERQILTAGFLSSMADFRMVTSVKKMLSQQGENFAYRLWNGQDAQLFCPTGTVGISVNSENKELAQDFIRVLLGSDVQGRDLEDGFPVNASAYEAFTENPLPDRGFAMGGEDREGKEVRLDMPWPDEQELEQLKTIIQSLETPAVFDDSLKNEVLTIGAQALRGDKEIEESAEEIAQKISLHLKE